MIVTGILYLGNVHVRNEESLKRICSLKSIPLQKIQSIADFHHDHNKKYNVIWSFSEFVDPLLIPQDKVIIYGPHLFVLPEKQLSKKHNPNFVLNERNLGRCIFMCPSQWVIDSYVESGGLHVPMAIMPFSVDIEQFRPAPEPKTKVMVYLKYRSERDLDFVLNSLVVTGKVAPENVRVFRYGKYEHQDYLKYLQMCKFGIIISGHESQGFAVEEALSCNVPLLVWNVTSMFEELTPDGVSTYGHLRQSNTQLKLQATSVPYWSEKCGELFYSEKDFQPTFEKFYEKLSNYTPRDYIVEQLNDDICGNRFLSAIASQMNTASLPVEEPKKTQVDDVQKEKENMDDLIQKLSSLNSEPQKEKEKEKEKEIVVDTDVVKTKMLILIHSTLVPDFSKPLSYNPTRSVFNANQRLEQTVETIKNVRRHFPDSPIILADNSQVLLKDTEKKLEGAGLNALVRCFDMAKTNSAHKGQGRAHSVLSCTKYINDKIAKLKDQQSNREFKGIPVNQAYDFDIMLVLSGRYKLSDKFDLSRIIKSCGKTKMTFRANPDGGGMNTVLCAIPRARWGEYCNANEIIRDSASVDGYENQLLDHVRYFSNFVDEIGAEGLVSVDGSHLKV